MKVGNLLHLIISPSPYYYSIMLPPGCQGSGRGNLLLELSDNFGVIHMLNFVCGLLFTICSFVFRIFCAIIRKRKVESNMKTVKEEYETMKSCFRIWNEYSNYDSTPYIFLGALHKESDMHVSKVITSKYTRFIF